MARPRVEPSSHCSDCCGPPPALNQRISSPSRQFSRRSSGCVARRAINRRVKSRSFSSFSVSPSQFTRRSRCPDNSRYYCPLRPAKLIACQQHRRAVREEERGEEVALLPLAGGNDIRVFRRPFLAVVIRTVIVMSVVIIFPVIGVMFLVVRYRSFSVKPSCAVIKLTLAHGRRPRRSYKSPDPNRRAAKSLETLSPSSIHVPYRGICRSTHPSRWEAPT